MTLLLGKSQNAALRKKTSLPVKLAAMSLGSLKRMKIACVTNELLGDRAMTLDPSHRWATNQMFLLARQLPVFSKDCHCNVVGFLESNEDCMFNQ